MDNITNTNGSSLIQSECTFPYNRTDEQWSIPLRFQWWIEGCGSITIGFTGIALNMTTICIVLGSKLSANFFNWLIIALVIFDSNFLFVGILEGFRTQHGESTVLRHLFVYILHYYRSVILLCSEYMTILLALERYQALTNSVECRCNESTRYNIRRYFALHRCRLTKYVGPVIVLASIFYIPKTMEIQLAYQEICINLTQGRICWDQEVGMEPTKLRFNDKYVSWYLNIANNLITLVIPFASLIFLNFNIFSCLKQHVSNSRLRRESIGVYETLNDVDMQRERKIARRERNMVQQTLMLFAIVTLFLISHTPRIILNLEEWIYAEETKEAEEKNCSWVQYWTLFVKPMSHLLLQVNSMTSAFIYCIFNSLFRETLRIKLKRTTDRLMKIQKCWK